jgi:hypothetical protein
MIGQQSSPREWTRFLPHDDDCLVGGSDNEQSTPIECTDTHCEGALRKMKGAVIENINRKRESLGRATPRKKTREWC